LEEKYAKLEGGVGAVATASGQSAILYAILNVCKEGDHVISVSSLYGGTVNLFTVHLKNLGIEGDYEGIGFCALGYKNKETPKATPLKLKKILRLFMEKQ